MYLSFAVKYFINYLSNYPPIYVCICIYIHMNINHIYVYIYIFITFKLLNMYLNLLMYHIYNTLFIVLFCCGLIAPHIKQLPIVKHTLLPLCSDFRLALMSNFY